MDIKDHYWHALSVNCLLSSCTTAIFTVWPRGWSKKQTKKTNNTNYKSLVYLTFYFNATFRKVFSCIFNRVFLQLIVRTRLYSDCLNFAQWQPVSWVSFHILEPQTQEGHAINIFKMLHEVQKYIYQVKLQVSSCLQTVITSSVPKGKIG